MVILPPPPLELFQGLVPLSPLASSPTLATVVTPRWRPGVCRTSSLWVGTFVARRAPARAPVGRPCCRCVCVCVCGLGVPSGGPELDSGVVLSLFHVVPLYAPGLPPPSPQRILDYFEQRRRVVYLVRAPRSVVWLFLFRFLFLTPAVPLGARWLGVGLDAGRSCRSQLRKSPHPLLCRTSTGRRSAATLAPASWWMDHATARSSASPATRSSTVTSTRP